MEILEIAYALIQGCGCFLEVFAVGSSAGAGVAGHKAYKNHKDKKAGVKETPPGPNWAFAVFVLLLMVAVAALTLVALEWLPNDAAPR